MWQRNYIQEIEKIWTPIELEPQILGFEENKNY